MAKGFVPKLSIKENAEKHIRKECLITVDIKDFFQGIEIKDNSSELS